jgi:murein DD-endopeptidase MepM/ murein hydrolase activator NlpD
MKYLILTTVLFFSVSRAQEFRILRPVPDNIQTNGSYLYGEPSVSNPGYAHRGIDILVKWDSVFSATNGTVYFVGYNPADTIGGYEPNGGGNYVVIKSQYDSKNIYLYYMHLKMPYVSQGQSVTQGQPIALSGNTGYSTGAHLHFEIRMNTPNFSSPKSRRNPELWCAITGMGAIYGKVPGASNNTRVDIFPDPKPRPPYTTFSYALTYNFADPYIGSDDVYQENYAIGDVKPGTYTIKALNGAYTRVVTVGPGQVVNADDPSSTDDQLAIIEDFALMQNYPNPFNPNTVISFTIPERSLVQLKVYDLLGNEVSTLVNEERSAGIYNEFFYGDGLASGVYVYSLIAASPETGLTFRDSKKMMFVK